MRPYNNNFDHQETKIEGFTVCLVYHFVFVFPFWWVVGAHTHPILSRTFPGSSSQKFEVGEICHAFLFNIK
jgi:hypothetical protein